MGRPQPAAHALHPRAQRDLRRAEAASIRRWRRRALRHRAARQRRADRQDPHGRVDTGDPRPSGAADRHERQLVGPARREDARTVRPHQRERGDQRHPRLGRRPSRRAVPAHRGVRLGLSAAPADPRRARDPLAGDDNALLDTMAFDDDHPAQRREGAGQRRDGDRPLVLVRHPAPGRGHPAQFPELPADLTRPDGASRPRRDRHHPRPRARRAALQRLPPAAPPDAGARRSRSSPTTRCGRRSSSEIYGDVERVDLQIGMHAETPPRDSASATRRSACSS